MSLLITSVCLLFFFGLICLILAIVSLWGLFFWPFKWKSAVLLIAGITGCCSLAGARMVAKSIRPAAFSALAERSRPLVQAIHSYEKKEGHPPAELTNLIPVYLQAIPSTGIGVYPSYQYRVSSDHKPSEWKLWVPTSNGLINFDQFLYLPHQNYPKHGYGGVLEPVGDWAYVHE